MFAGGSNYGDLPFKELPADLRKWGRWLRESSDEVDDRVARLKRLGLFDHLTDDYKGTAVTAAQFFKTAASEFDSVADEIEIAVEDHHIRRLRAVQTNAARYELRILETWAAEREPRHWMADEYKRLRNSYEEWEGFHAVVHQMCIDLWDLSNLIDRLQDFVGMRAPSQVQPMAGGRGSAWRSGSFYLIAVLLLLAMLVILYTVLLSSGMPMIAAGSLTMLLAVIAVAAVVVVGALQLTHDRRIGEQTLVKLVQLGLDTIRHAATRTLQADQAKDESKNKVSR